MIRKDIENLFSSTFENLIQVAQQKIDEVYEKIDKEKEYKENCNEAKNTMSDAINRINEILDLDLTTHEGYSKYMEYLGNLRNRTKEYDGLLKAISGKTAAEIIDEIAQKATTFYEENRKEKNETIVKVEQDNDFKKTTTENNSKNIVEPEYDDYEGEPDEPDELDECETCVHNPSTNVTDDILACIDRIVNRYVNESLIPVYNGRLREDDLEWLKDELVEFACWLNTQYPKK